jgi:hypothetical protein
VPCGNIPVLANVSDLLGVSPTAGDDEIKKAYRKRCVLISAPGYVLVAFRMDWS